MRNATYLNSLGFVAAAVFGLAGAQGAMAADGQSAPPSTASLYGGAKAADISGLWLGTPTGAPGQRGADGKSAARAVDGRPIAYWAPWPLPYTPAYQKIHDERAEASKNGRQLGDYGALCRPFGLPAMLVSKAYPDEIVQTPGQVTILVFNTFPIVIWTDGRGHPKDLKPSYNGHSIGHWDGDTLVVDTVGIEAATRLAGQDDVHSAKLHLKWTIEKVAKDTLHVHVTLYDEDAFSEPLTTTNIWQRKSGREWQMWDDASCFENNKNLPDSGGATGFVHF